MENTIRKYSVWECVYEPDHPESTVQESRFTLMKMIRFLFCLNIIQ